MSPSAPISAAITRPAMREAKKRLADNPKDTAALALIGRLYAEGAGVARDHKQAMAWFKRAAETGGAQGA